MKFTRKLMAMVLVICLMIPYCTTMTAAADTNTQLPTAIQPKVSEQPFCFGRSILEQMNNSDALLYAYDKLVEGCDTLSDHVNISHSAYCINSDEAFLVWEAVTNDHPEYFWLSDGMSLWGSAARITAFVPYVYDGIAAEQAQLNARVAELTAGLESKSDYEKSLILHDRLCDAVIYTGSSYDQNVIGSLVKGQAVCAGYARGYQLLLQTVGIPSHVVIGTSKGQGHAWNLVELDGEWYYTDVTWDDQNDDGGHIYYAYLNVTYDQMNEDHTIEKFVDYLPKTTATAANYHVVNGTAMDMPDAAKMAQLYEAGSLIRLYMTGDRNAFINALSNALSQTVAQVACPYSGYSCGTRYLGREIILNLTVSSPHIYNANNTCINCGYAKTEGHQYVSTIIDPDCMNDGYTIYTCTVCGDTYIDDVTPALGHSYNTMVTDPDCLNGGYTTYTCTVCSDSYVGDATPALGHTFFETERIEPTCTVEGIIVYACASCGQEGGATIPATGEHVFDGNTCVDCGYTIEIVITYGDLNDDGNINNRDLALLQQYLNGWSVTVNEVACDANADGNVNNRDLALLQQYLNGWSVTLG